MFINGGRFIGRLLCLSLVLILISATLVSAAIIRVDWSPSSAPDLDGYKLYYRPVGQSFQTILIDDPQADSRSINGLEVGKTYEFALQAYDESGNLSSLSDIADCVALPWDGEAAPPDVPVIVGTGQPVFEFSWNVSNFGMVAGAGLEVSLVNQSFENPNGTSWDPGHRCFQRTLSSPSGSSTMNADNFQGPGMYEIRVSALDAQGTIICCWSDSAFLEVIAGAPVPPELIVTGPGPGPDNPPLVRLFDPLAVQPEPVLEFLAYGVDRYGVNVCAGDVTGDGRMEIISGPGPGEMYGPQVRIFNDAGHSLHADFFAYGTLRWGVGCAVGDIDGDQVDEIVTGPGPGEVFGPHVRGWDRTGSGSFQAIPGVSFMAYGTHKYGAQACCGDIDGDGIDEIVTAPGPGAMFGPHIRAFNYDGELLEAIPGVSFFAYDISQFGANVTCGDIDGDGFDEIVTGPGPGVLYGPHVRGFDYDGSYVTQVPGVNFFAGDDYHAYGVSVACGDIDGDGVDEMITAPGPGPGGDFTARVLGWNYLDSAVSRITGLDFLAYDEEYTYGANVAIGRGVN